MALDNVGGGVSVQNPTDIGQGDVSKTGSVTSTAFNRSVSVEFDVESTEGLKSDKPKSEYPSIRERITTPVDPSKTRSLKQQVAHLAGKAAGKLAGKVVPDRLQEGASSLKTKLSKKAHAAFEAVSEKAATLKSKTIGKLLRMIRSENFSKVDTGATNNEVLKGKVEAHNGDVEKLAELKVKLKNEDAGLKEFKGDYKEALELLEHPEKFTASSRPRTITIPGGETRTINAGDVATRTKMVEMIRGDIMETSQYQDYELKTSQKAAGGTELYRERQELKQEMKNRAEDMVAMFQEEVSEDLKTEQGDVSKRRGELNTSQMKKAAAVGESYDQRTEEARTLKETREKAVTDLKEERTQKEELIREGRKEKSKQKHDAAYLRETAAHMRAGVNRESVVGDAEDAQRDYETLKDGVGKAKKRKSEIPGELKTERKARKDARKQLDELESGKARKKENEAIAKEWEAKEKKLDKEERQLDKMAKKRTDRFKKGLG